MSENLLKDKIRLENDIVDFLGARIVAECPQVQVEMDLSDDDFRRKYIHSGVPVIIKGQFDSWPAKDKWTPEFFTSHCAGTPIYTNLYSQDRIKEASFENLFKDIALATEDNPVYLQEWWFHEKYPELLKDINFPKYFRDDENLRLLGYYNSTMWIGSKGAKTQIHQDIVHTHVWTMQISGKKEWILFNRNAELKAKVNGEPDYDEFLHNPKNDVCHYTLERGDILLVPYKTWHRARTIEDAMSVNTFYVTPDITRLYMKDIMSIPMALCLNRDLLLENDPMRYNITLSRVRTFASLMGLNIDNILNIPVKRSDKVVNYDRQKIIA